jgi:ABC-2 type transport system ATP-binding protein
MVAVAQLQNQPIPAIEVTSLNKVFDGTPAVDDITFTVAAGQIVGLLGGNGAGKSTTLAMLLGLMQPTSGQIKLLGHDVETEAVLIAPRINFSSPYVDLPNRLTVRQNLEVYSHLYGVLHHKMRIAELAAQLQITELLGRRHGTLSAGQRTRASLAKSLLNKPCLLLLDEPTASLDPDTADWVRTLLMDYRQTTGATIFMASHNMLEVERMCDDVIMMKKGRIIGHDTPRQLIEHYGRDNLEEVFLDIARNR